jgi:hypothetical protein
LHEVIEGFQSGLVVAEALLDFVVADLLAEAVGDVGDVGQRGGVVAVGDVRTSLMILPARTESMKFFMWSGPSWKLSNLVMVLPSLS